MLAEQFGKLARRKMKFEVGLSEPPRLIGYQQNGATFFGRDAEFVYAAASVGSMSTLITSSW